MSATPDSSVEIAPLPDVYDHALCAELAALGMQDDPRSALTASEIDVQHRLWDVEARGVALRVDGRLCGTTYAAFMPGDPDRTRCFCSATWLDPVPDAVVRHAVEDVLRWACVPGSAEALAWAYADRDAELALWRSLGFREIGREHFLRRDLMELPLPPVIELPGVTITDLGARPDLTAGAYAIWKDGIRSIPGEDDAILPDLAQWERMIRETPSSPPSERHVALLDDEVVAYCSMRLPGARTDTIEHGLLAVRADHRGRGIGRMFKHFSIRHGAELGKRWIGTDNEGRNEPILHLNESLGFHETSPMLKLRLPRTTTD